MSPKDRLTMFGADVGFTVSVKYDVIQAVGVPCLLKDGIVGTCTIEKSFDPTSGMPNQTIGNAVHAARITTDEKRDGRVYHANGTPIGNYIEGDGKTWSSVSIKKGSNENPEEDQSASDLIHRYAKQIVGAASAASHIETASLSTQGPFKIPNTFEVRAAIGPVQERIRDHGIAIIGLGGTGAYILDIIAKTPLKEIHLLDSDDINWHNFMRAPGAPTDEEIESCHKGCLPKVDYYNSKYASLREGIYPDAIHVDNLSMFKRKLESRSIDFAFVCIDQITDSETPRQDIVYQALTDEAIPFIDSGVSLTLDGSSIRGAITTSYYDGGSIAWKDAIPNARIEGAGPCYRNVQLPEVNALAASLAVMEWRRRTRQYVSESASFLHKFRLETPLIRFVKAD